MVNHCNLLLICVLHSSSPHAVAPATAVVCFNKYDTTATSSCYDCLPESVHAETIIIDML